MIEANQYFIILFFLFIMTILLMVHHQNIFAISTDDNIPISSHNRITILRNMERRRAAKIKVEEERNVEIAATQLTLTNRIILEKNEKLIQDRERLNPEKEFYWKIQN